MRHQKDNAPRYALYVLQALLELRGRIRALRRSELAGKEMERLCLRID